VCPKRGASGLNGVLLVDKPVGMTSHDVVNILRKLTNEKRIGHAGTLDPAASGLLIMMVGKATKFSDQLTATEKTYRATITFGAATDTDDAEGSVIKTCDVDNAIFDEDFAQETIAGLIGSHEQMPPQYSAIKVGGRKSYAAARKGQALDLKPRMVEILSADLLSVDKDTQSWDIEVTVSKGTYIRALARDLGIQLGTYAHLSALRRLVSGEFSITEAYTLDDLKEQVEQPHELAQFFIPFNETGPSIIDAEMVIGVFDGLHTGHQALLEKCVASSRDRGVPAVMVTFDQLPERVLPERDVPPQLYSLDERIRYAHAYGIDHVITIPFTHELSRLTPDEFIRAQLLTRVIPRTVWVGESFRFGAHAEASAQDLKAMGNEYGFEAQIIPLERGEADNVSATAIREALRAGDVLQASNLLGRPYSITGTIDKVRGIGRAHGYPTANITDNTLYGHIGDGVYQGTVTVEDSSAYDAAIFIGIPSNSLDQRRVLEAHLIDFSEDLVDSTVTIEFFRKIRDVVQCDTKEHLTEVIKQNVKDVSNR